MLQKIEDKIVFLVSSATDEEIASEDIMVYYLDPYEDAPKAVYDAFESKQTTTEEYTDQWGSFRSIFIPITRNGVTYVLAADMQIDEINHLIMDSELKRTLKMFILVNVGFALFFWQLITSNRKLSKSNTKLNEDMNDLTKSHNIMTRQLLVDELTNCLNRRAYNQKLEELFEQFRNNDQTFSFAILDIDDFKHINDHYGHDQGDIVLKNLVNEINKNIRDTDYIFRVGGEEFVVLFPDITLEQSVHIAQRICRNVENAVLFKNEKVTISIGLAEALSTDDVYQIAKRADVLLYQAKNTGKNHVEYEVKD